MNPVTTIELMQVVGIATGAMAGFMGVFAGIFIWAANVRDKGIGRRMQAVELRVQAVEQLVERRYQETVELVERRHQETMSEVNRLRQEITSEVNRLRQDMTRLNEEGERRRRELLRAIAPL